MSTPSATPVPATAGRREAPPQPPLSLPPSATAPLGEGGRVIALSRPGVARTEVQVVVPLAHDPGVDQATARLLGRLLLAGSADGQSGRPSAVLRRLGATLVVSGGVDHLMLTGGVLTANLDPFLSLLGTSVMEPSFDPSVVARERQCLAEEVGMAAHRPNVVAAASVFARLYRTHPYGKGLPTAAQVAAVNAARLRRAHAEVASPGDATVVLAGDAHPERLLASARRALGAWPRRCPSGTGWSPPSVPERGSAILVDRPGAAQSVVMMAGPAPMLGDPMDAAMQVAVAVLGGHPAARLATNLRDRQAMAYQAEASLERRLYAANVLIFAAVGSNATGPAVVELNYELARLSAAEIGDEELAAARNFVRGRLGLSVQTRAGLVNQVRTLAAAGQEASLLAATDRAVAEVTAHDVLTVARRYLSGPRLQRVAVGDEAQVGPVLHAVDGYLTRK